MSQEHENEAVAPAVEEGSLAYYQHERYRWYAVQTQSGMEKSAKLTLEVLIKKHALQDSFGQVLIPTMMVEKIDASGKKKKIEQKMMPGYMFVQLDPNDKKTFGCVKDTPKISSFIGAQANQEPRPVPAEEVWKIFQRAAQNTKAAPAKVLMAFEKGESVRVIDGPFTSFVGDVDEVRPDKKKLRLLISVFGRATPVEIEFDKVEKIKPT